MVKPRSQQAGKPKVNPKLAEALADKLADKPYGSQANEDDPIERLTISLPASMYDELEALAKKRKRTRGDHRSMSAITREAIKEYLRRHGE